MPRRRVRFGFSIVGVQKGATSTLHNLVVEHPAIVTTRKKERHFFDDNTLDWDDPDYSTYKVWPKEPGQVIAGDSTPSYIFWPDVLPRMRAYRPDMPLIACFRDPVERAFSHWNMDYVRRRDYSAGFGDVIRIGLRSELPPPSQWRFPEMRRRTTVARGLYGLQLERGFEVFDPAQWLLLEFRATVRDLPGTASRIIDFLGLESFRPDEPGRRSNESSTAVDADPVTADDIELLVSQYADDLPLFTRLSGLDTSAWPTAKVLAGEMSPADLADSLSTKAGLGRR